MTNKEKKEYLSLALAYSSTPFITELEKRQYFHSKRPKRFFKFRNFDKFIYDMLDKNYVYIAPAGSLDDPFDCLTNVNLDRVYEKDSFTLSKDTIGFIVDVVFSHPHSSEINKEEMIRLISKASASGDVDYQELQKVNYLTQKEKELFSNVMLSFKNVISTITEGSDMKNLFKMLMASRSSIGVCSLTTKRDNKVMWSLYGKSYKGYCVEYEPITDVSVLKCLRPVIYTKKFDNDIIRTMLRFSLETSIRMISGGQVPSNIGVFDELTCTKDSDWKYQDEWRIVATPNSHASLKTKAVYLGFDVLPKNEERMKACAKRNGFALYKMNKPTGQKKITYSKIMQDFKNERMIAMAIITKKCKYCGSDYEFDDDWSHWKNFSPKECCDDCVEIYELENLLRECSNKNHEKEWQNKIHEKNMAEDKQQPVPGVTSYSSNEFTTTFEVQGRTKFISGLIDKLIYIRKILALEVGGYFEILDSIYEKKNKFWNETGNLLRYVHNASFEYVVIKLKECLSGSNSKYSITKIKNELINNRKSIKPQKIYEVFTYKNGDVFKNEYEEFPIIDYVGKLEHTLIEYSKVIKAIDVARDKNFAHINEAVDDKSFKQLSYVNLKRMYNMIRLIYDGFLFYLAPDKLTTLIVERNIWLSHLDDIVKEYRKNHSRDV